MLARFDDSVAANELSPDGLHMNDWSYNCFAKALVDAIADAAAPDRESSTDAKAVAGGAR
jgi:hypothetical protein